MNLRRRERKWQKQLREPNVLHLEFLPE